MTDEEVDKRCAELMGKCWHELQQARLCGPYPDFYCAKCKKYLGYDYYGGKHTFNPSPTTSDSDYMILVRYAMKHEKWRAFKEWLLSEQEKRMNDNLLHVEDAVFDQMFDRELGTKAIYEFFSKEGEK
jgi:hypothetical protein